MAYASYGLLTAQGIDLPDQLLFMAILVLGHDGLVIPVAIVAGWVAARALPPWARAPAQGALVVTVALTIVAIPLIVAAGTFPDNPSLLPLDYRRGLLVAVGVTWLVAGTVAIWGRHRARGSGRGEGVHGRRP
jgi:hypothetical protein